MGELRCFRSIVLAVAWLALSHAGRTSAAAYDDGARYAFAGSPSTRSVYVIDLLERKLADTIALERPPDIVAVSDRVKALLVASRNDQTLTLIDLSDPALERIGYDIGITPTQLLVSPPGEWVAVYDDARLELQVHAIRRREMLLAATNISTDRPVIFSLDGTKVYWVDNSTGSLNSVDLWGNRATITLAAAASGLSAMSRSIDGAFGFVSDADRNVVHVIDLPKFEAFASLRVGSRPGRPWGTSDGRYMIAPNTADGTVTAISTATGQSVYTIRAVDEPRYVAPGWLDTVAAVVSESGDVVFFDVETGTVHKRYELGASPLEGIVTSDSLTLAVPLPGAGTLAIFDMRRMSMLEGISGLPRDIGPVSLAVSNNLCH